MQFIVQFPFELLLCQPGFAAGAWKWGAAGFPFSRSKKYTDGNYASTIVDIRRLSDQPLMAEHYRQAAFTLVLSQCESFSMPVLESLCCGTPVYGFKAGGPESICPEEMKDNFVDNGDIEALFKTMQKGLGKNCVKEYKAPDVSKLFLSLY